nr:MAG TPA: hypothetical protein [Caudoviricetes sp.]
MCGIATFFRQLYRYLLASSPFFRQKNFIKKVKF